ncbi:SDR family oxidoreductase [Myxococcaceae bacterium GXIMD 01537]
MKDQRVVVIGGTSGMGLALAELAQAEGAHVVALGSSAEGVARARARLGPGAEVGVLDIGDGAAVAREFERIGRLDHLVTTAAKLTFAPLGALKDDAVAAMLATKFWGPFYAARAAAPRLSPQGSITFFSGLAAYRPGPGTSVVSAVNAGLEGFAKALAVELAPVRVNCISPGVVETPVWDHLSEAERTRMFDGLRHSLPARRIGTPRDLAEAALAVMSNPFITGTVVHVDGGGRLS